MNEQKQGITLVGLGPGAPGQLTRQAWDWLAGCGEVWLRTQRHPVVNALPADVQYYYFDELYERAEKFEEVYAQIVERVLELGRRPQGVTYAVPGHPYVAEATGPEIARRARAEGLPLRVIEGLSFLEPAFSALGLDPFPTLALVDALELASGLTPQFSPAQPALVAQIYSRQVAANVKLTLNAVYPDEHPVRLVHAAGTADELVEDLKLYEIDRSRSIGLLTALYVPPLPNEMAFENFQEIIARLRAPDGCPWDREQTHLSLRKHLLEETYETLEALDAENPEMMREEFGDLLLQIVLHAQIASEYGEFNMAEIVRGISDKIIRRHPHVFGEVHVDGVQNVLQNWEKLKAQEKRDNGAKKYKGLLDGVPRVFPALAQAEEIQDRAGRVGLSGAEHGAGLGELLEATQQAQKQGKVDEETLGALLFALAGMAFTSKVDAESALRTAILRFREQFERLEGLARSQNRALNEFAPAELAQMWQSCA
jgi:tetrapyrrole methylase family protein / MazG family protein